MHRLPALGIQFARFQGWKAGLIASRVVGFGVLEFRVFMTLRFGIQRFRVCFGQVVDLGHAVERCLRRPVSDSFPPACNINPQVKFGDLHRRGMRLWLGHGLVRGG